jgi:hypothetical protein
MAFMKTSENSEVFHAEEAKVAFWAVDSDGT